MTGKARADRPRWPVELARERYRGELENDAAALRVLLELARYGETLSKTAAFDPGEGKYETGTEEAAYEAARDVAGTYGDGAGAFEPAAVTAWVRRELAAVENTLDAVTGEGMLLPAGPAFGYLVETVRNMLQDTDADERQQRTLRAVLAVLNAAGEHQTRRARTGGAR